MTKGKFTFNGVGEKEEKQYEAEIEFYKEVDPEVSVRDHIYIVYL